MEDFLTNTNELTSDVLMVQHEILNRLALGKCPDEEAPRMLVFIDGMHTAVEETIKHFKEAV